MKSFNNEESKRKFTEQLYQLVTVQKISLTVALDFMKGQKVIKGQSDCVQKTASAIYEQLNMGNSFSYALRVNRNITFDSTYSAFISFAEKNGSLAKTLKFLTERCKRHDEIKAKIIEASVYPIFVVILAVIALILICSYGKNVIGLNEFSFLDKDSLKRGIFCSILFLLAFIVLFISVFKRKLGNNKLYEAFSAIGFLVNAGVSLSNAVSIAISILGEETSEGAFFVRAGERLLEGHDLQSAFLIESNYRISKHVYSELQEAFYFARKGGNSGDVFEKIANWLEAESLKQRTVCFKLIEPVLISGTGFFLLVFMGNILMPLISGPALVI